MLKFDSDFRKKRKYDDAFLQFGFTFSCINEEQRPTCVICHETLATESMKPSKLKRHLETRHTTYSTNPLQFFARLLKSSAQQRNCFEKHTKIQEKYLMASYEASYIITKAKMPYTIGEKLALPIAIKITETVHGKKYANELKKIPLSNDTVTKRIAANY